MFFASLGKQTNGESEGSKMGGAASTSGGLEYTEEDYESAVAIS